MPSAIVTKTDAAQLAHKHKAGHSGKPLFSWLQRKIAGTVKGSRKEPGRPAMYDSQSLAQRRRVASFGEVRTVSIDVGSAPPSPTGVSRHSSMLDPGSIWSPTNPVEADDDASIRPLPPTSPPSPAPSRSSSSYLSDPRTFRSIGASTKPTTVLSIDVPNFVAMAHIAQAPSPPSGRPSRPLTAPGASQSVAFSPLPISPASSRAPSQRAPPVQAPIHTAHHPRNNPRPSSPPLDNASMLTLASSAYAHTGRVNWQGDEATSVSHVVDLEGDSVLQFPDDMQMYEDGGASVRALRPRSERRNSWESNRSDWSTMPGQGGSISITGSAMAVGRDRFAPSWKTGPLTDDFAHYGREEDEDDEEDDDARRSVNAPVSRHVSISIRPIAASPKSSSEEDPCTSQPLTPTDAAPVAPRPETESTPKKQDILPPVHL